MTLQQLEQIELVCSKFNISMKRLLEEYSYSIMSPDNLYKMEQDIMRFVDICFCDVSLGHTIEIIPQKDYDTIDFNVVIDGIYFEPEKEYSNLGDVIKVALVRIYKGEWPIYVANKAK